MPARWGARSPAGSTRSRELPRERSGHQWVCYQASIGSPAADAVRFAPWSEARQLPQHQPCRARRAVDAYRSARRFGSGASSSSSSPPLSSSVSPCPSSIGSSSRTAGYRQTVVAPLMVDTANFDVAPDPTLSDRLEAARALGGHDWLFVGQMLPHKAHHDVIKALACARRLFDPDARLHLVGRESCPAVRGGASPVRGGARRDPTRSNSRARSAQVSFPPTTRPPTYSCAVGPRGLLCTLARGDAPPAAGGRLRGRRRSRDRARCRDRPPVKVSRARRDAVERVLTDGQLRDDARAQRAGAHRCLHPRRCQEPPSLGRSSRPCGRSERPADALRERDRGSRTTAPPRRPSPAAEMISSASNHPGLRRAPTTPRSGNARKQHPRREPDDRREEREGENGNHIAGPDARAPAGEEHRQQRHRDNETDSLHGVGRHASGDRRARRAVRSRRLSPGDRSASRGAAR